MKANRSFRRLVMISQAYLEGGVCPGVTALFSWGVLEFFMRYPFLT